MGETAFPQDYMLAFAGGEVPHGGPRCPELQQFTTSVRAYLDYTGQNYGPVDLGDWRLDRGFTLLCVLSGEAFSTDKTMCDANTAIAHCERTKKLFELLGYEYESHSTNEDSEDYLPKEGMRRKILESFLIHKRPAIVNKREDCPGGTSVVGYEASGETLICWNYHVFDFSPNPQPIVTRNSSWYGSADYLCLIGERTHRPDLKELYRSGLQVAHDSLTGRASAENADFYERWKQYFAMSEDDYIQEVKRTHWIMGHGTPPITLFDDDEAIRAELARTVDPLWCAYAERRYYAKHFMRQAKAFLPGAEEPLEQAACCFEAIEAFMDEYLRKVGHDPVDREKLRDPRVRAEMGALVDSCQKEEGKSIGLIRQALERLS